MSQSFLFASKFRHYSFFSQCFKVRNSYLQDALGRIIFERDNTTNIYFTTDRRSIFIGSDGSCDIIINSSKEPKVELSIRKLTCAVKAKDDLKKILVDGSSFKIGDEDLRFELTKKVIFLFSILKLQRFGICVCFLTMAIFNFRPFILP